MNTRLNFPPGSNTLLEILERLSTRYEGTRTYFEPDPQGISLCELAEAPIAVARELARDIAQGTYRFQPCAEFVGRVGGKERRLYRFCWRDRLVHGALAELLTQTLQNRYPPHLFSYRKKTGCDSATRSLAGFVKAHRSARPDKKLRGLFVLQIDVRDYGESIPVATHSPLWTDLRRELESELPREQMDSLVAWIQRAVDPALRLGAPSSGLPTGSPLVPPLNNLYLLELDRRLAALGNSWYGRYGDDLLFAAASLANLREAEVLILSELASRGLQIAPGKKTLRSWNGAGRGAEGITGTQRVTYLGKSLSFDGGQFPKLKRKRALVAQVRGAIQLAARAAMQLGLPSRERLALACAAVRNSLDPEHPFALPQAVDLRRGFADQRELLVFHRQVQLEVLKWAFGLPRSAKSFREVSPAALLQHGFPPLRNR